jgi:hypothetical protein
MITKLQVALLDLLNELLPANSQLRMATHSIGFSGMHDHSEGREHASVQLWRSLCSLERLPDRHPITLFAIPHATNYCDNCSSIGIRIVSLVPPVCP